MDQREAMNRSASASASYYLQRRNSGSFIGLQDSNIINSYSNDVVHFASNAGSRSIGSALPLETSPHHGPSTLGPPSAMLQGEPVRRKRGRPRKYGRDVSVSSALLPSTSNPVSINPTQKRRGRPPGTGRKPQLASLDGSLISIGGTLIPHIIHVEKGEDIKGKILSYFGRGQRAIIMLSGIGSISTVNCRISTSGGSITYEGRFEMLTLSGSYTLRDDEGPHNLSGALNVTLAGPDGRVIGGCVEGALIAASSVQVVVGSMLLHSSKTKSKTGESVKNSGGLEPRNAISIVPANIQPNQNLAPIGARPNL